MVGDAAKVRSEGGYPFSRSRGVERSPCTPPERVALKKIPKKAIRAGKTHGERCRGGRCWLLEEVLKGASRARGLVQDESTAVDRYDPNLTTQSVSPMFLLSPSCQAAVLPSLRPPM